MAKKRSATEPVAGRFSRQESKRTVGTRSERRYFLIVCEGTKTEPFYFQGLKKDLLPGILQTVTIDIEGVGDNTLSLVKKAQKAKAKREASTGLPIDRLWVVFDRDSFPGDHFNKAINLCSHKGIGCAWSNEAFELWYLIHFQHFESSIGRTQYPKMLTAQLRKHCGPDFRYQKNDPNLYMFLKQYGNRDQAFRHAEQLCERFNGREDFAAHNPCTTVHLLVKELLSLT